MRISNIPEIKCDNKNKSFSGILLCSFRIKDSEIIGVLHPNANYPFDRSLLPKIEFCRLKDGYQDGNLEVEWI